MKRLVSIAVSLLILLLIYWKIDFAGLIRAFQESDLGWMTISLGMVIPITLMTAWRLQQLMPSASPSAPSPSPLPSDPPAPSLSLLDANKLILAASSLNMVLPSKMGDIAKAYFMQDRGHLSGSLALSLVVFEKTCDMLSLLLWCAFGLLLYPNKGWLFWVMTLSVLIGLGLGLVILGSPRFAQFFFRVGQSIAPKKLRAKLGKLSYAWQEMHDYFWRDKWHLLMIALTSVFIWFLHLLQIWFFILALKAWTPFVANLALSPLAILAGLLPLTFAGVGTRDAALITLYQSYFTAPTAAALGVLCTSRYLLPAIGGLPFLEQYLAVAKRARNSS